MVAAVARKMSPANVTIYGMVCTISDYCEMEFETIDDLVIHLVNVHDEMWSAKGLKDIHIDGNLLEEVKNCEMNITEGEHLEGKFCEKYFDNLDFMLHHILTKHEGIFKGQV